MPFNYYTTVAYNDIVSNISDYTTILAIICQGARRISNNMHGVLFASSHDSKNFYFYGKSKFSKDEISATWFVFYT